MVFKMELKSKPGESAVWKLMPLKPSGGQECCHRRGGIMGKDKGGIPCQKRKVSDMLKVFYSFADACCSCLVSVESKPL